MSGLVNGRAVATCGVVGHAASSGSVRPTSVGPIAASFDAAASVRSDRSAHGLGVARTTGGVVRGDSIGRPRAEARFACAAQSCTTTLGRCAWQAGPGRRRPAGNGGTSSTRARHSRAPNATVSTPARLQSGTRWRVGRGRSPSRRRSERAGRCTSDRAQWPYCASIAHARRCAAVRATSSQGSVGTPLGARNVTRALHATLSRLGLPRQRFHDLRHAYATLMLEDGEELAVVSRSLGHSQLSTTADVYAH